MFILLKKQDLRSRISYFDWMEEVMTNLIEISIKIFDGINW